MKATMAIRIRRARVGASLTQTQLADQLDVHRSAVPQWEREPGGTHPSVGHLSQIAVATKVAFEWLATGRGAEHAPAQPAHDARVYAANELEAGCLDALRRVPARKQTVICKLLDELTRKR
ncbi:Helix-turn-helix [Pseudoxanthomonas sp. CF385]|uniref:helix-turn-helix transcriptional regulator n=1 Tax=Pseudoxanthomonas sp. CF385 TaxID=1881042 RepID=UPI000889CD52|nr:Helix-turn-helix [Pseudoxanthomonas sp. CF385]